MPIGPRPAPPAGTARVAVSGRFFTHTWVNVFYVNLTHGTVTIADLTALADFIASHYNTTYLVDVVTQVTLTEVDVRFFPTAGTVLRYTGTYTYAGQNTNEPLEDAGACYIVDWTISDYYRGGHPRTYIPGIANNIPSNGSDILPAMQANIVAAASSFRTALNGFTSTNISATVMGTVRFESAGAWLSPPRFVAFTSQKYGKNGKVASQRRRILS